jgi:hypothetical protein
MSIVLALLLAGAPAASAARPEPVRLDVSIEVDRGVPLGPTELRNVAREIARIWAPVLRLHVSLPDDVQVPQAVDRVRLVITPRVLQGPAAGGMGWIEFEEGVPRPEMTVSLTAISTLMRTGTWRGQPLQRLPRSASTSFIQRALARAAAHEIGHYLLRSPFHTKAGLMRALFTVDDIMDDRSKSTRLEPGQVDALRADLLKANDRTSG